MSAEHRPHQEEPAAYEPPQVEDVASEGDPALTPAGVGSPQPDDGPEWRPRAEPEERS